jgi:hypothetical protein
MTFLFRTVPELANGRAPPAGPDNPVGLWGDSALCGNFSRE